MKSYNSINDFKDYQSVIDNEWQKLREFVFHNSLHASLIARNNDELLNYYNTKKNKIIEKIKDGSTLYIFNIDPSLSIHYYNYKIELAGDNYDAILSVPKIMSEILAGSIRFLKSIEEDSCSDSEKEQEEGLREAIQTDIKDLRNHLKTTLKELRLSFKIQYYNMRLDQFEKNPELDFDFNDNFETKHLDVFNPYGFELFSYLNDKIDDLKTIKYSNIFYFMLKGENLYTIKCTVTKYLKFLEVNYDIHISRLQNRNESDMTRIALNGLKKEFFVNNHIKQK